jgi:hypothetical protein
MRDAMEKRFIRVAKGSLVGGARLGMFTATFFGIQNLLIENRGVHDVFNIAAAGSATAAAFGLICMYLPILKHGFKKKLGYNIGNYLYYLRHCRIV